MPGPYRRNYGAMGANKLMQCINELQNGRGDAYRRVIARAGDPVTELIRARDAAKRNGLAVPHPGWPTPPAADPKDEETVNHITMRLDREPGQTCRGCAGTGVDYSVHERTQQIAAGPWNVGPKPNATRMLYTCVHLGTMNGGEALALLLKRFAKAEKEGRSVKHATLPVAFPLTSADACTWCHGTGEPQLSVHSLTTTDGS